jgi:phosphoribosyl-AMP cyclohydrolase
MNKDSSCWFAERGSSQEIEQGNALMPKFDEKGLIPVVTSDHETGDVLMMAYMNPQALAKTIELGEAVYWSRSRQELWHKGATSGQFQEVVDLRIDCDQDALWMRVRQKGGGACHTGQRSCFYRSIPIKSAPPIGLIGSDEASLRASG